jgi:hypothetical protein
MDNLLNNIQIIYDRKEAIKLLVPKQTVKYNIDIYKESEITINNKLGAASAVGDLYFCKIPKNDDIYVYKKFKSGHGGLDAKTLVEMKNRIPIWYVLNKSAIFMKVFAIITDETGLLFNGLILENLSGYSTISDKCSEFKNEDLFREFITFFLSACSYLFPLNLCSFIEHGANIMIGPDLMFPVFKVIDVDDVGDKKFVGCENNTENQYWSIKQLEIILISCDNWKNHPFGKKVAKILKRTSDKYESLDQVIKELDLDIQVTVDKNDIEFVKKSIKKLI